MQYLGNLKQLQLNAHYLHQKMQQQYTNPNPEI